MNLENWKMLKRYETLCRNKGLTENSIKGICRSDIPLFIGFIGDKPLQEVNHIDVENFFAYCSNERKNKAETLDRKYTSLNSFFKTMIRKEYLDMRNPMDRIDPIKKRKKVRKHLTKEEIDMLREYVKGDLRGAALIELYYSSGCRLSEVWQLNKYTLDYERRQFKVLGKGEKERVCIFSQDAKEKIMKYLESRQDDKDELFLSREHSRWSKKSIQDYVKKAGRAAGITKNVHPHIFRHSRAMHLLEDGVPLETIQVVLGHESITTTQVYAHTTVQRVQSMIDQLDKVG